MLKFFILSVFLQTLKLISVNAQYTSNCVTPNRAPGACIEIRACRPLLNLLQATPLDPAAVDVLRRSLCGYQGREPQVCCPIQIPQPNIPLRITFPLTSNPSLESLEEPTTIQLSNPLLPTDCGNDLTQRIIGGEITSLDEFPWMVLLEYAKPGGKATVCGGALISRRYVLTAAHCLMNTYLRLESVRLGEYNTATNPDCIPDSGERRSLRGRTGLGRGRRADRP